MHFHVEISYCWLFGRSPPAAGGCAPFEFESLLEEEGGIKLEEGEPDVSELDEPEAEAAPGEDAANAGGGGGT